MERILPIWKRTLDVAGALTGLVTLAPVFLYVIEHPECEALLSTLEEKGISCGIHDPQLANQQAPYRTVKTVPHTLPNTSARVGKLLSLPMFPELSEEQIEHVVKAVSAFCESGRPSLSEAAGIVKTSCHSPSPAAATRPKKSRPGL